MIFRESKQFVGLIPGLCQGFPDSMRKKLSQHAEKPFDRSGNVHVNCLNIQISPKDGLEVRN